MKTSLLIASLVAAAATTALADPAAKLAKPVPPPAVPAPLTDVQRTVNAFVGNWSLDGTATVGDTVTKFKITYKCTATANGTAVVCAMRAPGTHRGLMEGAALVGYDAFSHKVHYMSVTSAQEFHDHTCTWTNDTTLTCDHYTGGTDGLPITEDITFSFQGKDAAYSSTVTMANGAQIVSVAKGKKS